MALPKDYRNNVIVTLNAAVAAGIGSISITPAQQALIPNGPQSTIGTLEEVNLTTGAITLREGILITNRAANILTVTRAYQEMPADDTAVTHTQISYPFDPVNGARLGLYWTRAHGEEINDVWNDEILPSAGSSLVHKTTNETIAGLKDFNTLPQQTVYAAPTINKEFAPKKYVDDQIAISIPVDTLFGDGSDGVLAVSVGTTTLPVTSNILIKQYENLTITGGILDFSGGDSDGNILVIKIRDTFTMSAGLLDASAMGGIGALGFSGFGLGANAGSGNSISISKPILANNGPAGAIAGTVLGGQGGIGVQGVFTFGNNSMSVFSGGGGGGGGGGNGTGLNVGGNGGAGGGGLIILAKNYNVTGGIMRSNGGDGLIGFTSSRAGSGGGGGAAGGCIGVLTDNLISNTGTIEVDGGNGGDGSASGGSVINNGGGGGGAGGEGETGGANGGGASDQIDGDPGSTATNSVFGIGGTGGVGGLANVAPGSDTGGGGGGGGGGAGEFYIEEI